MPKSILYYPSINIQNESWLKKVILYWDSVSSIVPDQYNIDSSYEIAYLRQEGLYTPVYPSTLFFSYDYREDCENFQQEMLRKLKSLEKPFHEVKQNSIHRTKLRWPELSTLIHYRKLPGELHDYMLRNNLVVTHDDDDWIEMERKTAVFYMATLAEYLAKTSEIPMVIGTDRPINLGKAFTRSYPNKQNLCFSVCFQNALPSPNPDISLQQIVRFRKKRTQELLQFRSKINQFEESISQCEDFQEIKSKVSDFRDEWMLALSTYQKLFKDEKIDYSLQTMKSLCSTSMPGIVTAIGTKIGVIPPWITVASLATGGAIGLGCSYMQYRKAVNQLRNNSGFAYLYDAERKNLIRPNHATVII